MMPELPPNLSPFDTNHPASSAYRITMSEHEWTWTQAEQEAMAKAIVRLDGERMRWITPDLARLLDPKDGTLVLAEFENGFHLFKFNSKRLSGGWYVAAANRNGGQTILEFEGRHAPKRLALLTVVG
jgi:hypothetical protein